MEEEHYLLNLFLTFFKKQKISGDLNFTDLHFILSIHCFFFFFVYVGICEEKSYSKNYFDIFYKIRIPKRIPRIYRIFWHTWKKENIYLLSDENFALESEHTYPAFRLGLV